MPQTIIKLLSWYNSLPEGEGKELARISIRECLERSIAELYDMDEGRFKRLRLEELKKEVEYLTR